MRAEMMTRMAASFGPVVHSRRGTQPPECLHDLREALREVVAGTAVQLDALVLLARNYPYAIVLDFVEPLGA